MAISQKRSLRKVTGGRYRAFSNKKKHNKGSLPAFTGLGALSAKQRRTRGGHVNTFLLSSNIVNVLNPKTRKCQKTELVTVVDSPANRHFVRSNIITRGTIVETKLGKVKITSRPGREGSLNAVLIS